MDERAAGEAMQRFWSLGGEVLHLDGATSVRSPAAPGHPLGTFLCRVRTADVAAALAERERRTGDPCPRVLEDVFVHPGHRRLGVATDLLRHAVIHARGRGAGPVLIGAEVADTPKHLYAGFGFRPVAVPRSYARAASTSS